MIKDTKEKRMSRYTHLEPLVTEALQNKPETRSDNFILYIEVLKHYIDVAMPMKMVFENHKRLGIPSLESITRCRRKIQERDPSLRDEDAVEARKKEEEATIDYAMSDKVWY